MSRRLLHLAISMLFFLGLSMGTAVARIVSRRHGPPHCVVLYYHDVASGEGPKFGRQMDLLRRLCTPVPASLDPSVLDGRRYAMVTFDDALQGVALHAAPELRSRGIPFTVFAPSAELGGAMAWVRDGHEGHGGVMTPDALRDLAPGLCTVGSHTRHHVRLTAATREEALLELSGSRTDLEALTGTPVDMVAFPYGSYDDRVLEWCREAGYRRAFGAMPAPRFGEDGFLVGRVAASPQDTALEFRLKLLGAYDWLPRASSIKRRLKRWMGTAVA